MPLKYFVIVLRKFLTEENLQEVELFLLSNEMKENLKLCINEIRCSAPNQDEPILRLLSKRSERSNLPVNFFLRTNVPWSSHKTWKPFLCVRITEVKSSNDYVEGLVRSKIYR